MTGIQKAPERMTSKQRVQNTFARLRTDRVPIQYLTNETIDRRLKQHLGLGKNDTDALCDLLGVDTRTLVANYIGPQLFPEIPGLQVHPIFGYYTKWVENASGGYWDYVNFPLENATSEQIAAYPVPDPELFDYETAFAQIKSYASRGKAVAIGSTAMGDIINKLGQVMGVENALVNLMTEDEGTLTYVDRYTSMQLGMLERLLKGAGDDIDYVWMGEDLGTQRAPMISMDMYREVLKPRHQRYIDLAHSYGKQVMVHSCGSSSWVYEEFIKMGVNAVDTLQPEAADMGPRSLVERFGGRLCFHGCISTAMLAEVSAEEVMKTVHEVLDIMMPHRGYFLAPTHQIQDNTPVENIIAMYQAAHMYGIYKD